MLKDLRINPHHNWYSPLTYATHILLCTNFIKFVLDHPSPIRKKLIKIIGCCITAISTGFRLIFIPISLPEGNLDFYKFTYRHSPQMFV